MMRTVAGNGCPGGGLLRPKHLDFALFEHIKIGRSISLPEDEIARIVMRMRDPLGLLGVDISQVARKQKQGRPIKSDLEAAAQGGEFKQVDAAPNEPGQESG